MYNELIKNMHQLSRSDHFTIELLKAISKSLEKADYSVKDFENQYFFDSATWYLEQYAKELGVHFRQGTPIDEKRAIIESKWKSSGKADIFLLQAVADSWKNGEIEVGFVEGKIECTFSSIYGIPEDLNNLENALYESKPAHLPIIYLFKYLLIKEVEAMTIGKFENTPLSKFAPS